MPRKLWSRGGRGKDVGESPSKQDRLANRARRQEHQAEQQGANTGERSGYQEKNRARKLAEGNKSKSGCFPKLFMLLLPFMAVGTYFLLHS